MQNTAPTAARRYQLTYGGTDGHQAYRVLQGFTAYRLSYRKHNGRGKQK